MPTEKEVLDRIRWDRGLSPAEFEVRYLDRIARKLIAVRFTDILRIEGGFMILPDRGGGERYVPLHRIREIARDGEVIWRRRTGAPSG